MIGTFRSRLLSCTFVRYHFFENVYFAESMRWLGRFESMVSRLPRNHMEVFGMLLEPEGPTVTALMSPKAEPDSGDRVGIVFMSEDSVLVICVNSGLSKLCVIHLHVV